MTDLITRAREEWLEVHKSPEDAPDGEAWHYTLPCPTDVVAALLGVLPVLEQLILEIDHASNVGPWWFTGGEPALQSHVRLWLSKGTAARDEAKAAIARALEGNDHTQTTTLPGVREEAKKGTLPLRPNGMDDKLCIVPQNLRP